MRRQVWAGIFLALFAMAVFAAGPATLRKQIEASTLVAGHVLVEPDGSVSGVEIDQPDKLPSEVVRLVERASSGWKFEPVLIDGQPRKAKARMSLRVVAKQIDGGDYRIELRSAYFGEDAISGRERRERASTDDVRAIQKRPPIYPARALRDGVHGVVYLILKIGRAGTVEDVAVEQVNLRVLDSEGKMRTMRDLLAKASIAAARDWTYQVPTTGEGADDDHWSMRVPIDFSFNADDSVAIDSYGKWEAYIPGPRQRAPWLQGDPEASQAPDAMIAGGTYMMGRGMKLLTPLQQGG